MGLSFIVKQTVPPAPPEPVEASFYSAAGADDGHCSYNTTFSNTATTTRLGHDYPCNYFCFYPTIPQGSTINSCVFHCVTETNGWSVAPNIYMRFINADNFDQPIAGNTTSKTNFQNATKTGSVIWPAISNPNVAGVSRTTPDFKTILQTIVDRTGWVSGNRLVYYLGGPAANIYANEFNGQGGFRIRTYEYGGNQPYLTVNWTPPA